MGHPILIYQGGKDFRVPLGKDKKHQAAITRNKE
jgi:hypothetical protein